MSVSFEQPLAPGIVSDYQLEVAPYDGAAKGADTIPTDGFVPVRGIQEITPPSVEKNLEDDSDLDSGGWGSQIGTGAEYTVEGTCKRPRRGGADDPGQEILKTAGRGVGVDGFVWWRLTSKTDGSGDMGLADVTFTEQGGSRTDLTLAEFTLTGRGRLVDVPETVGEPAAASQPLDGWADDEPSI